MDAKHKDALRELEIAALRGHPDGYATNDCTVTYKEAADALRAALARSDEADRMETTLNWALGCGEDFKPRIVGDGPYWWRNELAERAGLVYDAGERKYIAARALLQPAAPEAHDG